MQRAQGRFESGEPGLDGLDDEQDFVGAFDRLLPAVDGSESREEVDAGGEPLLDEGLSDAFGFLPAAGRGENQACVLCRYNH